MLPDRPAPDFTLKSFKDGGKEDDFTLSSVKGTLYRFHITKFIFN